LIQQIEKVAPASASLDQELEGIIANFRQTVAVPAPVAASVAVATPDLSSSTVEGVRFCTHCGKPLEAGHKFCAFCGTPVAQADTAAQV